FAHVLAPLDDLLQRGQPRAARLAPLARLAQPRRRSARRLAALGVARDRLAQRVAEPVALGQQVAQAFLQPALLARGHGGLRALHLELLLGAAQPAVDLGEAVLARRAAILSARDARQRFDQRGARGVALALALAQRFGGCARLALGVGQRARLGGERRLEP